MAMSQLVSDNFIRAGYPALLGASGNWSTFPWAGGAGTDANIPSAGLCEGSSTTLLTGSIYTGVTWAGDHYSEVTLYANTTAYGIFALARIQDNAGVWSGYIALINTSGFTSGGGSLIVRYYTDFANNVFGAVGSTVSGLSFSVGDVVRLTAQGTTITVTQNGNSIFSATDSHIAAGGSPGIGFVPASPISSDQISLWAGGEVLPAVAVQSESKIIESSSSAASSLAFGSNNTAGNSIIVIALWLGGSGTTMAINDPTNGAN